MLDALVVMHTQTPPLVHGGVSPHSITVMQGPGEDGVWLPADVHLALFQMEKTNGDAEERMPHLGPTRAGNMGLARFWDAPELGANLAAEPSVASDAFAYGRTLAYAFSLGEVAQAPGVSGADPAPAVNRLSLLQGKGVGAPPRTLQTIAACIFVEHAVVKRCSGSDGKLCGIS